jgi:hypothetical protein
MFESVTARDDHHRGWGSSLDQLAEYIATVSSEFELFQRRMIHGTSHRDSGRVGC